jgi:Sigma 54 modulation protein / S30EA ribosomal protein
MKIQINTGHNIDGREAMTHHAESVVKNSLSHLSDHVTRVEVHLSDENNEKGGTRDKRCVMEARLEHHQPIAVTADAGSSHEAIAGAAEKLKQALGHTIDRQRHH